MRSTHVSANGQRAAIQARWASASDKSGVQYQASLLPLKSPPMFVERAARLMGPEGEGGRKSESIEAAEIAL